MSKEISDYIGYGILALVLATLAFSVFSLAQMQGNKVEMKPKTMEMGFRSVTTGSTGMGDVSVELKPVRTEGQLELQASINTHSVDLSQFDLTEITTLEYDGKTAKPVSAPTMGGHHVNGKIVFDVAPEDFRVVIERIPKVDQRVFQW